MDKILLSVVATYFFILIGFLAKQIFKDEINEKSITIISVYFLQPFLTFWGLTTKEIDFGIISSPFIYIGIVFMMMVITYPLSLKLFKEDKKDRSIFLIASLVGNTANLGVPVSIAIFGVESVIYTTIINLANVFFVFIIGVYFYSRGNFSPKESIKNVLKLPVLWVAIIAIYFNTHNIILPVEITNSLQMGAYASIVLQLLLFGIYLQTTTLRELEYKLISWIFGIKFIALPLLAIIVLYNLPIDNYTKGILFIELSMPLAVANTNFASLYDCKPKVVTTAVFITSLSFLAIIFADIYILKLFGWIN